MYRRKSRAELDQRKNCYNRGQRVHREIDCRYKRFAES